MAAEYVAQGGQRADRPLRARDQDVRADDALHARPRLGRRAEARDAPAGDRRPVARGRAARPRAAAGARGRRGRGGRDHRRVAPVARGGALRRAAADPDGGVRRVRPRGAGGRRAARQADRLSRRAAGPRSTVDEPAHSRHTRRHPRVTPRPYPRDVSPGWVGVRDGTRLRRARPRIAWARGDPTPGDRRHGPDRRVGRPRREAGGRGPGRRRLRSRSRRARGVRRAWCRRRARGLASQSPSPEPSSWSSRPRSHSSRAQVRAALEASGERDDRDRRRLDQERRRARRPAARRASSAATRSAAREARGAEHASADLFDGATWFLTPLARDRSRSATGSSTASSPRSARLRSRSTPQAHDRLVALTSHLPHALANLLVNQAGATRVEGHEPLAAAGGSLRDMTRVAGANPRIWVDIFLENAGALARVAGRAPPPDRAARGSARRRRRAASSRAGSARRPATAAGCSPTRSPTRASCSSCASTCPTGPACSPGSRRRSARERINIEDFELHHVSPERGGTLTLLVTGESEARAGGRAARVAGLRRRRLAGAGRMKIEPATALRGHIAVPGDKSISHRAVLLGAIADGETRRRGLRPLGRHRVDDRARCARSA